MATNLRAGKLFFKVNGTQYRAKGEFTYNLGADKHTMIAGSDSVHGYKSETVIPYIEGAITDGDDLDVKALAQVVDATVTLELANGKVISLQGACYAADADVSTSEGEVPVRFEGLSAEEIK